MIRVLNILLFILALMVGAPAFAVDQGKLGDEIAARRARVPEFVFIAEEAKKLGVRAWLFGGTAAGYAHYVKWDLAREGGDARYQKDRFDYDYTNIYRSTQDLDIVIDGPPEKAALLERLLQSKFPHFQGSKSAWEVRLLREPRGDKEALLGNPNYLNQHTDSNSTGMIELTDPPAKGPVVRDLLQWEAKDPNFLKDVREGKLHYYFSPRHASTSRAKQGLNPPIESAIRYLTKAFQYELEVRPEDLAKIKEVVDGFRPGSVNDAVANWIEKNGKKLFQHAVNLEYARETVDQLGLAKKLSALNKNPEDIESLAWWMQKEPLRSRPVGEGKGITAREAFRKLGLDADGPLVVAHETKNFLAYESITRAHTGQPNVFISRKNAPGEAALYGDGFYTRIGRQGAVGSGLTIRFTLDPAARSGTDFIIAPTQDYVVVKNKNAIRVIPESLNWSYLDYLKYLASGEESGHDDQALMEKLRRRVKGKVSALNPAEYEAAARYVREAVENGFPEDMLHEWFSAPKAMDFSQEILDHLTKKRAMGIATSRILKETRAQLDPRAAALISEMEKLYEKFRQESRLSRDVQKTWDVWFKEDPHLATTVAGAFVNHREDRDFMEHVLTKAKLIPYTEDQVRLAVANYRGMSLLGRNPYFNALFERAETADWKQAQLTYAAGAARQEPEKLLERVLQDPPLPYERALLYELRYAEERTGGHARPMPTAQIREWATAFVKDPTEGRFGDALHYLFFRADAAARKFLLEEIFAAGGPQVVENALDDSIKGGYLTHQQIGPEEMARYTRIYREPRARTYTRLAHTLSMNAASTALLPLAENVLPALSGLDRAEFAGSVARRALSRASNPEMHEPLAKLLYREALLDPRNPEFEDVHLLAEHVLSAKTRDEMKREAAAEKRRVKKTMDCPAQFAEVAP